METTIIDSGRIIKTPVRVLDHHINRGFLWDSFYITVRLLDPKIHFCGNSVAEFCVNRETYYGMEIGGTFAITLYLHSDGKYYSNQE